MPAETTRESRVEERKHRYDIKLAKTKLERRGTLTSGQAETEIEHWLNRARQAYFREGYGSIAAVVQNRDGTVDGEVVVNIAHKTAAAKDVETLMSVIWHVLPLALRGIDDEIWFSIRPDYTNLDPSDDVSFGDSPPLNQQPLAGMDDLKSDRWSPNRFQLGWQRGQNRVFSHVAGIIDANERIMERFESSFILPTSFALKLHWNPWLVQPPRLRLHGKTIMGIVRMIAERNESYCPWCLRCGCLVRMAIVERFYWRCKCGAEHDERDDTADEGGKTPNGSQV